MRILLAAAFALVTFGFFGTPNAEAGWKCQGGYVACGSADKKRSYYVSPSAKKDGVKKRYTKKASKKKYVKRGAKKRYTKRAKLRQNPKDFRTKRVAKGRVLHGKASFYWQPQPVASGGRFNPNAMTAAHKTLPFGTRVRVTHAGNGRSVVVRINDRGPYIRGRIIDLSRAAAGKLQMRNQGVANVRVEVLGKG